MCSNQDAVVTSSMSEVIKRGKVFKFKKRLLGKNWREGELNLHEDSTLTWYPGSSSTAEFGVRLKSAPEMIAAGQYSTNIPGRPDFPDGMDVLQAIAIGSRQKKGVSWFACLSEDDMIQWMNAISTTLPPPPSAPPPPSDSAPLQPSAPLPPPGHSLPPPSYGPPQPKIQHSQQNPGHRQAPAGQNTVIIRERDDGFASGMMAGALAGGLTGWGMGVGFGVPMYGFGFGAPILGGYGPGLGGYHDHDTHIHNEYNYYNNSTNNDVTNNYEDGQDGQQQGMEPEPVLEPDQGFNEFEDPDVFDDEGLDAFGGDFDGGMDMDFGDF